MKKLLLLVFILSATIAKAQFVLTPHDGLRTTDGVYTITRTGSSIEQNYAAMKDVVKKVISNVRIREFDQEHMFTAIAETKVKLKFKDMVTQSKTFDTSFTLKLIAENDKIILSFEQLGNFVVSKFGSHYTLYPTIGGNNIANQGAGLIHIFNSSGEIVQPKTKEGIEAWANSLVSQIEQALK